MKTLEARPAIGCHQSPDIQLNLNVRGLSPSATVAINSRSDELRQQGKRIFKLGLGQSPFPVPQPMVEELKRNAHQKAYLPVEGLPELRQAVVGHHSRTFGINSEECDVLVGPGSKELMFILQLVYYGDLVVPAPAWVSYAPQARIIGRRVSFIQTRPDRGWRLAASQLDELCRTDPRRPRIVILNYPSNPTGSTYSSDELQELAEVARRYRVILLSDEIYAKLHHRGEHVSIVPFYPEGTIFSGGISKWCGAGGWRLGVFVFPGCLRWLEQAMAAVASETFTSTCAPVQYAAISAFEENEEIDLYLRDCRRILRSLGNDLTERLRNAGLEVISPEGGFYLFPDFSPLAEKLHQRGIETSQALCERLLIDTGVATLPGVEFGRPPEELTARIAYVDFNGGRAIDGIRELTMGQEPGKTFLVNHCANTIDAVDRICDWVTG